MTISAVFVLLSQLPNLVNWYAIQAGQHRSQQAQTHLRELQALDLAIQAGGPDVSDLLRQKQELVEKHRRAVQQSNQELNDRVKRVARLTNLCLPIGWLPLGVMAAAEGEITPAFLGCLGMTLIAAASLWRTYRATIRQYQGQAVHSKPSPAPAAVGPAARGGKPRKLGLEARLPGLSEPVSAVALGGFLSILRAPEAKMVLLTPVFLVPVFGIMLIQGRQAVPELIRPLFATGAMLMILFGLLQLMINQFGFDRDGFRVFVLSSARRRDILLGKNLAVVPVALLFAAVLLPIVEWFYPMRLDHVLATIPQSISMYLLLCMLTNLLSIVAPYHLPAGTMKPTNLKVSIVMVQVLVILFLFPLTQGLTLLPLGVEALALLMGWGRGVPICLLLSLLGCALVILIYALSIEWLGKLLQAREQRILECVTSRAS
jgi:hypothetical protein